jgi:cobalt-zinc-cadmium resistance protein CzcA
MLTAGAAAMGFLPMAISSGAGAEVQRPLATVVIGGLVTSTMLTMIALPLMFEIFYKVVGIRFFPLRFIRSKSATLILLFLLPVFFSQAQTQGQAHELTMQNAIELALENNLELKAQTLSTAAQEALIPTAIDLGKTTLSYGTDQNNIAENNHPLKVWSIGQDVSFPTLYSAQLKANKSAHDLAMNQLNMQTESTIREVSQIYIQLQVLEQKAQIYKNIDSLYARILWGADLRHQSGETSRLDLLNMRARRQHLQTQLHTIKNQLNNTRAKLTTLTGFNDTFSVSPDIPMLEYNNRELEASPYYSLLQSRQDFDLAQVRIEKNKLLPDFSFNYFVGTNAYDNAKYYHGFEVGLAVPLFFNAQKARIKAASLTHDAGIQHNQYQSDQFKARQQELLNTQMRLKELLDYYQQQGRELYEELLRAAQLSFENGDIDFFKFAASTETALQIQLEHLENLQQYNSTTLELNYLSK